MKSLFKKIFCKPPEIPTPYENILDWDSYSIGDAAKEVVGQIGENCDDSHKSWATAAALVLAEISNSTNSSTGSVDLKGVLDAQGAPIGDYLITIERISEDPFPEPPRKLLGRNKKRPEVGDLSNKQLRALAFLFGASLVEKNAMRLMESPPTQDDENLKIFEVLRPMLLDEVVGALLKKGGFEKTAVCFDDAVNMLIVD